MNCTYCLASGRELRRYDFPGIGATTVFACWECQKNQRLDERQVIETLGEMIERVRMELVQSRGKISDLIHSRGYADRLRIPEHGLTLIISYLYHLKKEIEQNENQKEAKNQ